MGETIRVCFVCLGNICRSPTAEAVFLDLIEREGLRAAFVVDSAGTGGWHVGERAHADTRAAASARGIEITSTARQFEAGDFERFDYVVAMDRGNRLKLNHIAPDESARAKIHLFREFDPAAEEGAEVPDPYYEGGFDAVYDICESAAHGFLAEMRSRHRLG